MRASVTASTSVVPMASSLCDEDNDELKQDNTELEEEKAAADLLVKAGKKQTVKIFATNCINNNSKLFLF